jgi:hypothetical protein
MDASKSPDELLHFLMLHLAISGALASEQAELEILEPKKRLLYCALMSFVLEE